MKLSITLLFCYLLIYNTSAQTLTDTIHSKLAKIEQSKQLPGFAVGIVTKDSILYQQGFGYANLATHTKFTTHTVQNIGSISKTLIAVAIMQLIDEGKLSLNTEINSILPFEVIHPRFKNIPITVRHLVTHTSGILDSKSYGKSYVVLEDYSADNLTKKDKKYFNSIKKNQPQDLKDYLESYLVRKGKLYKRKNFGTLPPGSQYDYSNVASALAAYMVEVITGKSYADYTQNNILTPLKMNDSSWKFSDIKKENLATVYFVNNIRIPRYTLNTYPDGGLLSSCNDLSLYLKTMMQGYYQDTSFLSNDAFSTMLGLQYYGKKEHTGVFWDIAKNGNIGHNGGDPGIFTFIQFDPIKEIGWVFMTNVSAYEEMKKYKSFIEIWRTLLKYGVKLKPKKLEQR